MHPWRSRSCAAALLLRRPIQGRTCSRIIDKRLSLSEQHRVGRDGEDGGKEEAKQLIVVVPNGVILWHLKLGPLAAMMAAAT